MENYKVVSITDREGNPRTDGRYPDRVGRRESADSRGMELQRSEEHTSELQSR